MNENPPFFRNPNGFGFEMHNGGAGAIAWTIFALQLLLLVGIVALLVRPRFAAATPPTLIRRRRLGAGPDPLAVVRMRYARGEISREEYLQATQDLGGPAEPPVDEPPAD